ncbi:MAG TPA: sterol desaturase family protein [Caulobacteraceae bacterium]|nr:sterol desaturase family protein [Caulobacteraceae bacterium]
MKAKFLFTRKAEAKVHDLGKMGLRELVPAYFTYPAIIVYLTLAVVSTAAAIRLGALAIPLRSILAAGSAVAMYPVIWYLLHRFILHSRFLYRFPATARLWKRIHFDHHQDPNRLDVLFGSLTNTLPTLMIATVPVGYWIAGGWSGAATATASGLLTTCAYEFFHCIQHLNYQPKNPWLKRIKKLHMAHHFHDETGNFGIVSFWVDRLAGTAYEEMTERPRSRTVFNLGYDEAEARRFPWVAALSPDRRRRNPAPAE